MSLGEHHGLANLQRTWQQLLSKLLLPFHHWDEFAKFPRKELFYVTISAQTTLGSELCMACVGGDTLSNLHSWHPSLAWEVIPTQEHLGYVTYKRIRQKHFPSPNHHQILKKKAIPT